MLRLTRYLIFLLALTGCAVQPTPIPAPVVDPTRTPSPTALSTFTPTPSPLPTATPPPTITPTPTLAVTAIPDWRGAWDIYVNSPVLSIVNTIEFQLPTGDSREIRAEWLEGTRPVLFEGEISEDGRMLTGLLYNSDVDVYEVTIALSANGMQFSGPIVGEAGTGSFCGTRPGLPRPNPCGKLPP